MKKQFIIQEKITLRIHSGLKKEGELPWFPLLYQGGVPRRGGVVGLPASYFHPPTNHPAPTGHPSFLRRGIVACAFTFVVLFSLLAGLAHAQSVSVTVNVLPPYSSYLQDYASKGNQVQIFVRNTSTAPLEVRLLGKVTGDNGVTIATPPNFRPSLPLRLGPMENRLLNRADLEGLFDVAQFVVEGFDRNQLVQGKPLPEGNYQLCVEAYDNRSSRLLSAEFPLGCSAPFMIRYVEPPILIAPLCDEAALATTPQALPFTWSPPAGVAPNQVRYTVRVLELPLEGVDPNVYIDAVNLPLSGVEVRDLKINSFLYSPQYPKLTPGKRYAWRVQASDPTGKLTFLNEGKSPVCAFTYGKSAPKAQFDLAVTPPTLTWAGLAVTDLKVTNPDPDHFSGKGKIKLLSPLEAEVPVSFKDLTVRPTGFKAGQFSETKGYHDYVVMKGTTEVKLAQSSLRLGASTSRSSEGIVRKLKTAPHTGGTAELTYRTLFLQANLPFLLDESKNVFTKNATDGTSGTEVAEVRGSLKWESPLLTSFFLKPSGADSKFSAGVAGVPVGTTLDVTALKLPASTGAVAEKTGPNAPVPVVAGVTNPANTLTNVPGQTIGNLGSPSIQTNSAPGATPGTPPGKKTALASSQTPPQAAQTGGPIPVQADPNVLQTLDDGSLRIPFNNKYDLALTTPLGFKLTLLPTSEFRIKDGLLWVVLDGSLLVPSGREDLPGLTVPIEGRTGLAFTVTLPEAFAYRIAGTDEQGTKTTTVEGKQYTVNTKATEGFRAFLRLTKLNVKLAELPDADDLPFPLWVTGLTVPKPKVLFAPNPSAEGTLVPIQLAKNIGFGFTTKKSPPLETADAEFKGKTKFLGFPAQFTAANLALDHTRLESGLIKGLVYVPFVGMVGELTVPVTEKGLGEANVHNFSSKSRELVVTPAGDRVLMMPKGGSFVTDTKHGTLFVLDARFRFFNGTDPTHFLQTGTKGLGVRGIGIHPNGKLYNPLDGFFGSAASGNVATTNYDLVPTDYVGAELNGLNFQVRQTKLETEKTGGNTCTLTLAGTLTLGEKITTNGEQTVSVSFPRPTDNFKTDDPDLSLTELAAVDWQPAGNLSLGLGGTFGPSADPDEAEHDAWLATQREDRLAKAMGWSAPAGVLEVEANQTIKGSFDHPSLGFIEAEFTLFNDDATYGNGFRASVTAKIKDPIVLDVKTLIITGKRQNVKYWFVEVGAEGDAIKVPLFIDLEAYGFKGRFYHHMIHASGNPNINNEDYVVDDAVQFGAFFSMPVRSSEGGHILWGRTAFEVLCLNSFVPSKMYLQGDFFIQQVGGTGDATTSRIKGNGYVTINILDKSLSSKITMTHCDLTVGCATGSLGFYCGANHLVFAVGEPGSPVQFKALCGMLGSFTPSASGYLVLYATNGYSPLGGVPTHGLGVFAKATATLIDLDTRNANIPIISDFSIYAQFTVKTEATFRATLATDKIPDISMQASLNQSITLVAGYYSEAGLDVSAKLVDLNEGVQFSLPNPVCVAYNKRVCYPVIGGFNLVLAFKNGEPRLKMNGSVADMCFNDGTVQGECEGLFTWVAEGVQYIVDKAGKLVRYIKDGVEYVLDAAGKVIGKVVNGVYQGLKSAGCTVTLGIIC